MAKKKAAAQDQAADDQTAIPQVELQRPAAEVLYAAEITRLAAAEEGRPRPQGWQLSPQAVLKFVLGDDSLGIQPKFVGSRSFLERSIVSLATNRGLMLIGEPGTAKSYLSELLAAAISGDSTLVVQGSAGTTEDNIKYSWNYALLLAEGPSEAALVPAPLYRGLKHGKIVRFEEITRCPVEIQDTLLSILSERVMAVPELPDDRRSLFARAGFNVVATANTRDRGVNEMSAALKRRFNFETVQPIVDIREEIALVQRETERMLSRAAIPVSLPPDVTEVLVTTFRELRTAKTIDGKGLEPVSSVLSTAEAVSTGFASAVHAYFYDDGAVRPEHLVQHFLGTALKDSPDDLEKIKHYFQHVVKKRSGPAWQQLYDARTHLP